MLTAHACDLGIVVFAGAGVSMVAPSSLPSWYAFNEVVLDALAERCRAYTRRSLGDRSFAELLDRRNSTTHFPPDYMAEIIAEECGPEYFRVLQSLDTDDINACHLAVAALASAGYIRAVITTNFDRLFERAFQQIGVPYQVYAAPEEFVQLHQEVAAATPASIPVIKVHGSVERPQTMVDTLSQRLVGRPEDVEQALAMLYARHHVLFLGFSGADLDYDSNYLGLRAAASANCGFTYLTQGGSAPRPAILELAAAWGESAALMEGTLPGWLKDLVADLQVFGVVWPDDARVVERLAAVREHAGAWARSLGDLTAINILTSLLRAGNNDTQAGSLLWAVYRHYRRSEDAETVAYARYNHLIGRFLLEYGFYVGTLRPPTSSAVYYGDPDLNPDQTNNAFQFLARAVYAGLGVAVPDLAECFALIGQPRKALEMIGQELDSALAETAPIRFVDAAIAGGTIWQINGIWTDALPYLETAHQLTVQLGREPRRARLCAQLVRCLGWKERFDEAAARYAEGERIAMRLGMQSTYWELQTAWGYTLIEQGRAEEAIEPLAQAYAFFQRSSRMPALTRAALDYYRAAMVARDETAFVAAEALLNEVEVGYAPLVHLLVAEAGLYLGDLEHAALRLEHGRKAAEEQDNRWAIDHAAHLAKLLARRRGSI